MCAFFIILFEIYWSVLQFFNLRATGLIATDEGLTLQRKTIAVSQHATALSWTHKFCVNVLDGELRMVLVMNE